MKRPNLAEDVIPLATFRARAAEMIGRLDRSGRPLVITQRGRSVAIVMSPREFERMAYEHDVARRVLAGLRAADRDEMVDDDHVWAEVERVIDEETRSRDEG